jgi:glycosyltransferase involved in cell wall biosynthesis
VGPNSNSTPFNPNKQYLGEWDKLELYKNLTNYANMLLLSDGEGAPAVIKEAMIAGLGIVTNECSVSDLEKNIPWVTVIPEQYQNNIEYVSNALEQNRQISLIMRQDIRNYAIENWSWQSIVTEYINVIENLK